MSFLKVSAYLVKYYIVSFNLATVDAIAAPPLPV